DRGVISQMKDTLDRLNADLSATEVLAGQLSFAIEDAALLISEIERTLIHLREGEIAGSSLGPVSFLFCPSCFTPLKDSDHDHQCKLCRSDVEPQADKSRWARIRNELELQFKESRQLQEGRKAELAE